MIHLLVRCFKGVNNKYITILLRMYYKLFCKTNKINSVFNTIFKFLVYKTFLINVF